MRPMLTFVLLLFAARALAQTTPCDTFGPGSPSCPYQWVGVTTVVYDGSGNGLGFVGMTSQCRADFGAGARMCKSAELMDSDTLNFNAIPEDGCWVRPVLNPFASGATSTTTLDASGVSAAGGPTGGNQSCRGWSTAADTARGLMLRPEGGFDTQPCDVARPIACCKPTPVPAPTSSLSLPIGAGALAGLASLKGGG